MPRISGPAVILAFGGYHLELWGEDTLEALAEAIGAAYDEHARNG